jgi:hypothetical protein
LIASGGGRTLLNAVRSDPHGILYIPRFPARLPLMQVAPSLRVSHRPEPTLLKEPTDGRSAAFERDGPHPLPWGEGGGEGVRTIDRAPPVPLSLSKAECLSFAIGLG